LADEGHTALPPFLGQVGRDPQQQALDIVPNLLVSALPEDCPVQQLTEMWVGGNGPHQG
jgi:hypothetical protein